MGYHRAGFDVRLPRWADEWADDFCTCGARRVYCTAWGRRHIVCGRSGGGCVIVPPIVLRREVLAQ